MVLGEKDKEAVRRILAPIEKDVHILFFRSDEPSCRYCDVIEELLSDIQSTNPHVHYTVLTTEDKEAKELGVEHGPTILFEEKPNIRFMGIPSGHEFRAFLDDIVAVGTGSISVSLSAAKKIAKIKEPIEILVFVTPTCPYCPMAVKVAHSFAFINPQIRGTMVEAMEYPDLADAYNVSAVPKVVVRDKGGRTLAEWEGALPEDVFADRLVAAHERRWGSE